MILKSVTIENFRGIKRHSFEFDNKFNLIIGNNGMGKTAVLEAVAIGLGGFLVGVDDVTTIHFTPDDVRSIGHLVGDGSYDIEYFTPTVVSCVANFADEEIEWNRSKSSQKKTTRTVTTRNISKYATTLTKNKNNVFPIISYQSAGRMWTQKRDKWEDVFKGNYLRNVGYTDCLASESNIRMLTNWCQRMEYTAYQKKSKVAEYESVKQAVCKFMDVLENTDTKSTIFYDERTGELVYFFNDEALPLRYMSAGYLSLIGMVADIAYRMAVLNPGLKNEVTERTSGIVLIDEIDLHIHPKWQWRIAEALMQTFPCVQFISTTHSPIVIASCKNKKVISLFDADARTPAIELDAEYIKSPYGWRVNDVLNTFMGVDERSPEVKPQLEEIKQLSIKKIKNQLSDQESNKLNQLKDDVYSNLPQNDAAVELAELGSIEDILMERGKGNAQS
ncbi:MAG: AAA family ATPase [Desulfitobacteriaceae bacterium]